MARVQPSGDHTQLPNNLWRLGKLNPRCRSIRRHDPDRLRAAASYRFDQAMSSRADSSWATSDHARKTMRANRGRDTGPEMVVRSAVHRMGLRYRVICRPEPALRRTADLVFQRARVAVFIDGCFWHSCPRHGSRPRANRDFWSEKLDRNIQRDAETTKILETAGWIVLRFWEHEPANEVAERIREAVISRA